MNSRPLQRPTTDHNGPGTAEEVHNHSISQPAVPNQQEQSAVQRVATIQWSTPAPEPLLLLGNFPSVNIDSWSIS